MSEISNYVDSPFSSGELSNQENIAPVSPNTQSDQENTFTGSVRGLAETLVGDLRDGIQHLFEGINAQLLTSLALGNDEDRALISDTTLQELGSLSNLKALCLDECLPHDEQSISLTNQGVQELSRLIQLTALSMNNFQVSLDPRTGLDFLVGLTRLQSLELNDAPSITDHHTAVLSTLTTLTNLELRGQDNAQEHDRSGNPDTELTAEGAMRLTTLVGLKHLDLRNRNPITDATAAQLHLALPATNIFYDTALADASESEGWDSEDVAP
ncbi:MAG: hypothetical protein HC848_10005 [Limnobacter sp.]|nr:hypothetical protein [Limnobacter sp.]